MKLYSLLFMLFFSVNIFGQQNFFNVPSSDITPKGKTFFQQQVNLAKENIQSNTTLSWGLGKNWEVGVNLLGIEWDRTNHYQFIRNDTEEPFNPFATLNAQKRVDINEKFAVSVGVQTGITATKNTKSGTYGYSNAVYTNEAFGIKLIGGLYYTSDSFFGREERNHISQRGILSSTGVQFGVEQNLWKDKLFFQADFISGSHALGEAVLGGAYFFHPNWVLSLGYQIPTNNSLSINSLVIEMTFVPSAGKAKKIP